MQPHEMRAMAEATLGITTMTEQSTWEARAKDHASHVLQLLGPSDTAQTNLGNDPATRRRNELRQAMAERDRAAFLGTGTELDVAERAERRRAERWLETARSPSQAE